MHKSRYTETQIIKVLSGQEQNKIVAEICREHGVSQPTFDNWQARYRGTCADQLQKMKEMESELASSSACTPTWSLRTKPEEPGQKSSQARREAKNCRILGQRRRTEHQAGLCGVEPEPIGI